MKTTSTSTIDKQPICLPSLKLLGDYWTLRIIDELSADGLRFCELERRLQTVNPVTLTKRLKDMQENGLVDRRQSSRADVTYALTELGQEAIPLLQAVNQFSKALKNHTEV